MRKSRRRSLPSRKLLLGLVAAACVLGVGATSLWASGPHFTGWSEPVNLGPTINTAVTETAPALSKNGLSLYFYSPRTGGSGLDDIWVSQRKSKDDAWGTPVNLGPTVNSAARDYAPTFSRDGHWMFIASDRPGGFGGADVWVSWRKHTHDDFGWQAPVNLGPGVNSASADNGTGYFENDKAGAPQLFFGSDRLGPAGNADLYVSELQANGSWGPGTLIPELNSTAADNRPNIRQDGLEIFFYSARAGGVGGTDLWVATRATVDAPWSTPVNVGAPVNTIATDIHPYLSADAETLFFGSSRVGTFGGLDLYVTTRSKRKPIKKAEATLLDSAGNVVGTVELDQEHDVVTVKAEFDVLPAGFHGFHVHTTGNCTGPAFTSAGGHLNPAGVNHGGHAGDMPVLLVNADGSAEESFETDRFTVDELFDADGSAIVVHGNPDNYANIPTDRYDPDPDAITLATGDAGARFACGVVESKKH